MSGEQGAGLHRESGAKKKKIKIVVGEGIVEWLSSLEVWDSLFLPVQEMTISRRIACVLYGPSVPTAVWFGSELG